MTEILTLIADLDLPPQQETIRAKCYHPSGLFLEFKKEEIEQSIPKRFAQIAAKYPDQIGVKSGNCILTYNDLVKLSNGVSHAVLARANGREAPVALLFEPGARVIAAILGALKAGKIYVPLDPSQPPLRLERMLEDSQAGLILTNDKNFSLAHQIGRQRANLINIDEIDGEIFDRDPDPVISPDTLAYILYTSGSTGQPKGVMQTHRNVLHNTMIYVNHLRICPQDKLTLLHSCCYGASINDIFAALLTGATLVQFDVREQGTTSLRKFLTGEKISIYHSVPAVFRDFAQCLTEEEDFGGLRIIHLSGTAASKWDFELYKRYSPSDCIFVHRLGSTEATTVFLNLMDKECEIPGSIVPVGFPVNDKQVFLVDENGQRVGFNCVGEIIIQSRYLSPGYWRDSERTQATFQPDPNGGQNRIYHTGDLGRILRNGYLEHLGRKDSRVKIRGQRIEISEIEIAILNSGKIKEAAVVAHEKQHGEKELVAYVVPARDPAPSVTELRQSMQANLPLHMIPAAFVFMDNLPLLPNGKLDRKVLPQPTWDRSQLDVRFVAPRTPVEEIVTSIWLEILGLERVGVKDNFFELGGHSLLAARVVIAVQDSFRVVLELRDLFDNPTIEEVALTITEKLAERLGQLDTEATR